jgi:cytidyltransferase-like protein
MVFGALDGLHAGHIYYLKKAKRLGKRLIVVVAPDRFLGFEKMYKMPADERMRLISELGIAGRVVLGHENDALARIKKVKPDIVAITEYHWVDEKVLQHDLKQNGLKTKVVLIQPYNRGLYDPIYQNAFSGLKKKKLANLHVRAK